MKKAFDVIAASGGIIEEFPWGRLRWISNSTLHPGAEMTVGECLILPGQKNTQHEHPNCEETLLVLSGECDHAAGDEVVHLSPGMAIRVSTGVSHYARCTSWEPLKAVIVYSSPDRRTDVVE